MIMLTNLTKMSALNPKLPFKKTTFFTAFCCTIFCFLMSINAYSQEGNCATSNCVASDIKVQEVKLVLKNSNGTYSDLPTTCSDANATYKVSLRVKFNVTSQTRYGFLVTGSIYFDNVIKQKIANCTEATLLQGEHFMYVDKYVDGTDIIWKCGEKMELRSTYTAWNSSVTSLPKNPSICSYYDKNTGLVSANACKTIAPKCRYYGPNESFVIVAPLSASFTETSATCPSPSQTYKTYTFTATASGGYVLPQGGAYTYKWYINNVLQSSATTSVFTYLPTTGSAFTVKLEVLDQATPTPTTATYPNPLANPYIPYTVTPATCCTQPIVSDQPSGDEKCVGESVSFMATATGTPTPTVQWQEKVGNGSFTNITNGTFDGVTYAGATGTTLTVSGLKSTMNGNQYRAVFTTSSTCNSVNSDPATLTVNPTSVGGTASAAASPICLGSGTMVSLQANTYTGSIVKWEFATNGTWSEISNSADQTSINTGNLTATTRYRAVVKSGSCPAVNSNEVTVTVDPPTQAGAVSGGTTVCSGTNSGTLQLGGTVVGDVIRWESAPDNNGVAGAWAEIKNNEASITATSYSFSNLTTTTWFRAVVQSGVCASANATPAKVTVDPISVGGTAGSAQTVCSGSQPTNNLSVSGITGNVIKWQKSTDNFVSSIVDISSSASSTLLVAKIGTLTEDTWFRAVVQSGVCDAANSSSVKITVGGIPEKPAFTVAQPSLCGPAKGSITICQSISGYNYTVGGITKAGTGLSLTFADLVAGSNPTLSIVNTTGNCPASNTYTCDDAATECPEQVVNARQSKKDNQLQTADLSKGTTIKAFPNPFNDRVKFVVTSETAGKASLEVFNMLGQKVKTVYTGHVAPGVQNFELSIPTNQRSTLIYVWRMGEKQVTGKLFQSGN